MTETLIEIGILIVAVVISLAVGIKLRRNAKAHERSVETLEARVSSTLRRV